VKRSAVRTFPFCTWAHHLAGEGNVTAYRKAALVVAEGSQVEDRSR
jgi:hypothetical protein